MNEESHIVDAPRFTTLQAVVRDWSRYRRISELQGLGWTGDADEEGERRTRLWVSADRRIREEWDTGEVRQGDTLEDASNWPLLKTGWLADTPDLVYLGTQPVAGRDGAAFEAHHPPRSCFRDLTEVSASSTLNAPCFYASRLGSATSYS